MIVPQLTVVRYRDASDGRRVSSYLHLARPTPIINELNELFILS